VPLRVGGRLGAPVRTERDQLETMSGRGTVLTVDDVAVPAPWTATAAQAMPTAAAGSHLRKPPLVTRRASMP
jgi:hypothetical protein